MNEQLLHLGSVILPLLAAGAGWVVKTLLSGITDRLIKIESKLDVAAEARVIMITKVDSVEERLDRLEVRMDQL